MLNGKERTKNGLRTYNRIFRASFFTVKKIYETLFCFSVYLETISYLKDWDDKEDEENRKIIYALIESFLGRGADKEYARQRLALKSSNDTGSLLPNATNARISGHQYDRKAARSLALKFKRDDSISGEIGEDKNENIFN